MQKRFQDAEVGVAQFCPLDALRRMRDQRLKSFSSALANAGISADVRLKLTGHMNLDVHQRYTHVQLETIF